MKYIFTLFFLFCGFVNLISLPSKKEENNNVITNITFRDLSGDYSNNPGKEITLHGTFDEKIIVFPKKSLFAKDFRVSECDDFGCTFKQLSNKQKKKLDACNFEGQIKSDSDSKVSLVDCNGNGVKDISIISRKVNFQSNLYRVTKKGKVNIPTATNFSDEIRNEINEDKEEDYSILPMIDTFIDGKNMANFVMDVNSECCRPARAQGKITEDGKETFVTNQKGRILCNKGEFKYTCKGLKKYVKKKAENQPKDDIIDVENNDTTEVKNNWITIEKKKGKKIVEETKQHQNKLTKESQVKENGKDITDETTGIENISEEGEEDSDEEEYDEYEDLNENKVNTKTKNIRDMNKSELLKMVKQINQPQNKAKKNPKCSNTLFRSTQVIFTNCKGCRRKEPIPKAKIYSERTVEFGVFVDSHVYKQLSEEIRNSDGEKIKEAIVEMVHSLFIEAETYTTHSSFTSLQGGFKFALNGIQIYKDVNDEETREWEAQRTIEKLLESFKDFAYRINGACDADQNSFDGMVLLTGRKEGLDVEPRQLKGMAYSGALCEMYATSVLTLRLDGRGSVEMNTGRLLAHELGHMFGSDHDGTEPKNKNGVYGSYDQVPCPAGSHLMSPGVDSHMKTWSTCTQKMIDAENQRREKTKKNCLFT